MINKKLMILALLVGMFMMPVVFASNCTTKVLDKQCSGNYVLLRVQNSDCSIRWQIGQFCAYGCAYGDCITEKTLPVVFVKSKYVVTDSNPLIAFTVKNLGTRGNIYLTVEGNVSKWIEIPKEITLETNESRDIIAVVNFPHGLTGSYNFVVHAKGAADYYAPSVLILNPSEHFSITGSVNRLNVYLSLVFVVIIAGLFAYFSKPRKKSEETF